MSRRRCFTPLNTLGVLGLCVLASPFALGQNPNAGTPGKPLRRPRLRALMQGRGLPGRPIPAPENVFLNGSVRRFYTEAGGTPSLNASDLKLSNMASGPSAKVYPKLEAVRAAVASDPALTAFLASPEVGPELRTALDNAILYSSLPRPGESGFNEFNALNAPAGMGRGAQLLQRLQGGQAANPFAGPNESKSARKPKKKTGGVTPSIEPALNREEAATAPQRPGLLGDLKARPDQPTVPPAAPETPLRRVLRERMQAGRGLPRDFSAFVGLSPDGASATLYVFGSMPQHPNDETPVNFTVEGRFHAPESGETLAAVQPEAPGTLLDKQSLNPQEAKGRFFCFAYPVAAPPRGGQINLMITFWLTPSNALTHGIALSRPEKSESGASSWIAIPMTRVQRFQKDFRYNAVTATEPGQPINYLGGRK